jgi:hypothetical protein
MTDNHDEEWERLMFVMTSGQAAAEAGKFDEMMLCMLE